MSSALNLDEEVRLYSTNAEREKYETLATLFGIIVALDYLERAYVRDSVTAAEYWPLLFSCFDTTEGWPRGIHQHARGCYRSTRQC
jgi:hypothetical protein